MKQVLEFAVQATREAGLVTLDSFGSGRLQVTTKPDGTPVTNADRDAERVLRDRIREAFPEDGILGEEEGDAPGESGRTWILDPIDGTKSFMRGVPLYGTLVGLEVDGCAVLGVAYFPALGELMYGAAGLGAHWVTGIGGRETTRPARVSPVARLDQAVFCTTSMRGFEQSGQLGFHDRLRKATGFQRGWSDCYGHMLVATGRVEVMVDAIMNVWDCAALQPIVQEAGGAFFDLHGQATHRGGSAISTNAWLADTVLALLAEPPEPPEPPAEPRATR